MEAKPNVLDNAESLHAARRVTRRVRPRRVTRRACTGVLAEADEAGTTSRRLRRRRLTQQKKKT